MRKALGSEPGYFGHQITPLYKNLSSPIRMYTTLQLID